MNPFRALKEWTRCRLGHRYVLTRVIGGGVALHVECLDCKRVRVIE